MFHVFNSLVFSYLAVFFCNLKDTSEASFFLLFWYVKEFSELIILYQLLVDTMYTLKEIFLDLDYVRSSHL